MNAQPKSMPHWNRFSSLPTPNIAMIAALVRRCGEFCDLSETDTDRLSEAIAMDPGNAVQILVSTPGVTEQVALLSLAKSVDCGFLPDLEGLPVDEAALSKLGFDFCVEHSLIPSMSPQGVPRLVCSRIFEASELEEANFVLKVDAEVCLASPQNIRDALRRYRQQSQYGTENVRAAMGEPTKAEHDGSRAARFLERVVADAVAANASDIHMSPIPSAYQIRVRINGRLIEHEILDYEAGRELLSRLKFLSGMSVTEAHLPQDGSCQQRVGGRAVEIRVSTMPSPHGESVVCRLLDPQSHRHGWTQLGFEDETVKAIIATIERPNGLFVVAGPTGSGKTTTIYTALQHLNSGARKIISIEDPIEQSILGVDQVQIDEPTGLSFGKVLRSSLRHDPDVIMIGEIRDAETAEIACRAALLGRLVIATVHAKDVNAARERFVNLGLDRYLVDEVLIGILSQRLQPLSCPSCNGDGCKNCNRTGVSGRQVLADFWSGAAR